MRKSETAVPVVVAPVHINGVTVVREMARKGARVVGVAARPDAPGLQCRFLSERVILPSPHERPGAFASFLSSRSDLHGAIVVPTDDFYLREIVENYGPLSKLYKLAVSPPEVTAVALDKSLTYAAAEKARVPMPRTRLLDPAAPFEEALDFVGLPAILRPAFSIAFYRDFGVKSFLVVAREDAAAQFERARAAGHKMLLQEIIPGEDENVVSCKAYVADSGEVLGAVAGFKLAIYPPRFGVSQMQETRPCPPVEEGTRTILRSVGFRGSLVSVEWKFDRRDHTWKFLEINARCVMAIALMKFAGSDIIEMLRRDKLGLPQLPPPQVRYGRRWAYIKNGLLLYRKYPGERKSFLQYLRRYRPPICFAFLSLTDPKPFLYDIASLFRRRLEGR